MKRLCILLALALLLAPAAAQAEICTVTAAEQLWTGVTAAIAPDCTEDATDAFIVPIGATLTLTGAVTLTTGTITIEGGTLNVPCGYTLTYGARLHLRSGRLRVLGCERTEQRVTAIAWGAASATVTLPIADVATVATAGTDWLVYGDDDPEDAAETIHSAVQAGPGNPTLGTFRPAYNKWSWYDINTATASGSDLVYYYDSLTGRGGAYTAVPYAGVRGPGLTTPVALTSAVADKYGFTTDLATAAAGAWIRADLGSQYVEYTSGVCTGLLAKILDVIDAGATETITVAGDTAYCGGTASIQINYGARVGDRVRVIRPATLNGSDTGPIILSGGTFEIDKARLTRIGYQAYNVDPFDGAPYATIRRACNVCVIADSAIVGPAEDSYMTHTEISYPTAITSADTAVLALESLATSSAFRYDVLLSLAGIRFDRLHIHDGINDPTSSNGTHGLYTDSIGNLTATRVRIERLSDDLYGESNTSMQDATRRSTITLRQALLYEGIAGSDNSQECFEPSTVTGGNGPTHEFVIGAGAKRYSDIVAIGCYGAAMHAPDLGQTYERMVSGGIFSAAKNAIGETNVTNLPVNVLADYQSTIRDSIFGLYGTSASATSRLILHGVSDGIIAFPNSGTLAPAALDLFPTARKVFASMQPTTTVMMNLATGDVGARWGTYPTTVEDSVFSGASTAMLFAQNLAATGQTTMVLRRVFLALGSVINSLDGIGYSHWKNSASACPGDTCPIDLTVDGLILSSVTPNARGLGGGSLGIDVADSSVDGACLATSSPIASDSHFGSLPTTDGFLTMDVRPLASEPTTLRAFLRPANATGPCDDLRPTALGIQSLGVSHAMLGDFFLAQLDHWSDKDLGKPQ